MLNANLKKISFVFILLNLCLFQVQAKTKDIYNDTINIKEKKITEKQEFIRIGKPYKTTAIIIALLTGPLGGHRVYLGTSVRVPLIYTATLGGFGILVVADIVAILTIKDISTYQKNNKIFMWISSK
ncbi:MAG TPA: TM2 domain-containing protein [Bacteroidales bacterium]|nr:TM2 domain-containing protein [Bacteroidales bacterium]